MTLTEIGERGMLTSKVKGFTYENIDRHLMLTTGELAEAQNELAHGHTPQEIYYADPYPYSAPAVSKPEGFGVELADAVIRIAILAKAHDVPLDDIVKLKMDFNDTRPYKHGKQF